MAYLWVFIGGGLGSLCRYGLGRWLNPPAGQGIPVGTLLANLLACLILGVGFAWILQHRMNEEWRLLALTGFCGGFSTFSTFALELVQEGELAGRPALAALYLLLSLAGGVGAIWLGRSLVG